MANSTDNSHLQNPDTPTNTKAEEDAYKVIYDFMKSTNWFERYKCDRKVESIGERRNTVLIVAALIAAVTFQAGVNPPGGVWQDTVDNAIPPAQNHTAGQAIYFSDKSAFYVFLISNTLALSASIMAIISLTNGFPFFLQIWMATGSMMVTYGASIFAICPRTSSGIKCILFTIAAPLVARVALEVFRWGWWKWKGKEGAETNQINEQPCSSSTDQATSNPC